MYIWSPNMCSNVSVCPTEAGLIPVSPRHISVIKTLSRSGSLSMWADHFHWAVAPVSGTHSVATDRRRQQTTNPCLGLQNKDKGFSLPPSHSLLSSLLLSVPLPCHPVSQSLSRPPPLCLAAFTQTHTDRHTHTWVLMERPGSCHCLPGYLLSRHLVGEKGLACLLTALRMLFTLWLSPATLTVLFSARCGQAPYVGLNEAYPWGAGLHAALFSSTLACVGMNEGGGKDEWAPG